MSIYSKASDSLKTYFSSKYKYPVIKQIGFGLNATGVLLEDNSLGVSFSGISQGNKINRIRHRSRIFETAGTLHHTDPFELVEWVKSEDHFERVLGIAIINALSQSILKRKEYQQKIVFKLNIFEQMNFNSQDRVAVIGFMPSVLRNIEDKGAKALLVDNNPRKAKELGYKVFNSYDKLENFNKAFITGSAMIFQNFENLVSFLSKSTTQLGIFGPTAGILPELLFSNGFTVVGGQWVLKPEEAFLNIIQGGIPGSKGGFSKKYWVVKPEVNKS
ncbi:MAG: Rossmann-like domain-containing protein [Candidatus Ranarchaeia archaeon]